MPRVARSLSSPAGLGLGPGCPAFDWPLSRDEKKSCALRLYDKDLEAANELVRSGEAALKTLRRELRTIRVARANCEGLGSTGLDQAPAGLPRADERGDPHESPRRRRRGGWGDAVEGGSEGGHGEAGLHVELSAPVGPPVPEQSTPSRSMSDVDASEDWASEFSREGSTPTTRAMSNASEREWSTPTRAMSNASEDQASEEGGEGRADTADAAAQQETAERLRLAIASATAALSELLESAAKAEEGAGGQGGGECAQARTRSEGTRAKGGDQPVAGVLKRRHSRGGEGRRVSFADDVVKKFAGDAAAAGKEVALDHCREESPPATDRRRSRGEPEPDPPMEDGPAAAVAPALAPGMVQPPVAQPDSARARAAGKPIPCYGRTASKADSMVQTARISTTPRQYGPPQVHLRGTETATRTIPGFHEPELRSRPAFQAVRPSRVLGGRPAAPACASPALSTNHGCMMPIEDAVSQPAPPAPAGVMDFL